MTTKMYYILKFLFSDVSLSNLKTAINLNFMKDKIFVGRLEGFKKTVKTTNYGFLIWIVISFSSCSFLETEEVKSIYEGVWTGSYTGQDDYGRWKMVVDVKGSISGSIRSELFDNSFEVSGNVENSGELYMSSGETSSGATFKGLMFANSTSGTWENPVADISGVWDGMKSDGLE